MEFGEIIVLVGATVESAGVLVIVLGAIVAIIGVVRRYITSQCEDLLQWFRKHLNRAMMLGLDFMVAGDIIRTVIIAHSIEDLASLGLLVVIRTILVFTIHLEVEGSWPWQSRHKSG